MARNTDYDTVKYGTYRNVQKVDDHAVMIVTDTFRSPFVPAVIVFTIFTVIFCLLVIALNVKICQLKKANGGDKPVADGKGDHVELSGFDTARSGAAEPKAEVAAKDGEFGPETGREDPHVETEPDAKDVNVGFAPEDKKTAGKAGDDIKEEAKEEEKPGDDAK